MVYDPLLCDIIPQGKDFSPCGESVIARIERGYIITNERGEREVIWKDVEDVRLDWDLVRIRIQSGFRSEFYSTIPFNGRNIYADDQYRNCFRLVE